MGRVHAGAAPAAAHVFPRVADEPVHAPLLPPLYFCNIILRYKDATIATLEGEMRQLISKCVVEGCPNPDLQCLQWFVIRFPQCIFVTFSAGTPASSPTRAPCPR